MNLETAPVAVALFFMAAIVLTGFTFYAHKAGRIKGLYMSMAGALLGLIFAILTVMTTGNLLLASVLGFVLFGWFLLFTRQKKTTQRLFDRN